MKFHNVLQDFDLDDIVGLHRTEDGGIGCFGQIAQGRQEVAACDPGGNADE
jgi:hypothetical protein